MRIYACSFLHVIMSNDIFTSFVSIITQILEKLLDLIVVTFYLGRFHKTLIYSVKIFLLNKLAHTESRARLVLPTLLLSFSKCPSVFA